MAKTDAEYLFEQYATERNLQPVYEPDLAEGPKKPDFLLKAVSGSVLCEVEQFGITEHDRWRDRELAEKGFAGSPPGVDPWKRIRNTIEDGCAQLKPFAGSCPLVVVLFQGPGTFVPLDNYMIQTALHGNQAIVLDSATLEVKGNVYSRDRALLWDEYRAYLSAVAVLERYRPMEEEINTELEKLSDEGVSTDDLIASQTVITARVLDRHPGLGLRYQVLRLRVVHNPFADCPLQVDVFSGPFDEQVAVDPSTGSYTVVWPK